VVEDQLMRLTKPQERLGDLFAARAAGVGMIPHRCTPNNLKDTLRELLASLDAQRVVLDPLDPLDPALARLVTEAVAERGSHIIDPNKVKSLDAQFDAIVGITGVFAVIAETGTLVLASDTTRSRGTFLIPPVHIAVVRQFQVIPDMLDLWPLVGNMPPTALTLITGPSKTADIEGILVTGVHGPGAVHVILVAPDS
jgi:L-lactate dehydrogenase complex protein LldG